MYLSLRNARAKTDALTAVAELTLETKDLKLFRALLSYKNSVEKARNDIAHGVFGVAQEILDGLVWTSTTDYTVHQTNSSGLGLNEAETEKFRKNQRVYELGDLETIALQVENLERQISYFNGYLTIEEKSFRTLRYKEMCDEPRIREELNQLHH